jgi:hypothetical protein
MSVETSTYINQDPDEIGDILAEYGLSLDNLAAADTIDLSEPETVINDPDDVTDFLAECGIEWGKIAVMDFATLDEPDESKITETQSAAITNAAVQARSPENGQPYQPNSAIPVIDGEAIFQALQTAAVPEVRSLGLSREATETFGNGISEESQVGVARRLIREVLRENIDRSDLHLNEDVIFQACLGASEALQNALRHGGGARRIILGATPYGNIFIGIENQMLDNLPHEKTIGKAALGLNVERAEDLTDDLHMRGLFLMAVNTVNGLNEEDCAGLRAQRTISAGLSSLSLHALETLAQYQPMEPMHNSVEMRRTLAWGVYGYDTEAARLADELAI